MKIKGLVIYIVLLVAALAFFNFEPTISGVSVITIGLVIGGLEFFGFLKKIPVLNTLSGRTSKGQLAILLVAVLVFGGYLTGSGLSTDGAALISLDTSGSSDGWLSSETESTLGAIQSGEWGYYPANAIGGTYTGTATARILDYNTHWKGSEEATWSAAMALVAEGNTGSLKSPGGIATATPMSVSSGKFTKNQLTLQEGSKGILFVYQDATPAAGENRSFAKSIDFSSMNTDTGKWNWAFTDSGTTDSSIYNYPTTLNYNGDTAVTIYQENESASIEKTVTWTIFPTNNGEVIGENTALYYEIPEANAASLKSVKITGPTGATVTYTSISETSINDGWKSLAKPALTTSTDKMYFVGNFPEEGIRTSTSEKAVYTLVATYDHPASGSILGYFKHVHNANAETNTGGHYDGSSSLTLNMTAVGTDGWT